MKTLTILELEYKEDSSLYFEHFIHLPYPCFLDSSVFDGDQAVYKNHSSRYDIMTAAPELYFTFTSEGHLIVEDLIQHKSETLSKAEPFAQLSNRLGKMSSVDNPGLPFVGGMVGFWGYELCEHLEPDRIAHRDISTPLMSVGLYQWALISDHKERRACLVFHPDISAAWKTEILNTIDPMRRQPDRSPFKLLNTFIPTQTSAEYQCAFQQIQDYIAAGDCYEVNLTQRFTAPYRGNPWEAFKKLRTVTKAPYSAFILRPDLAILSHSPEQFIRLENGHVSTKPIKGTRPRGRSAEEDRAFAQELQHSQKDQSENLMIVDLLRNDLGKVCKTGTVTVPRLFALESYANVHHLVSTVKGQLRCDHDAFDLLRSTFPGGSITGAPKIRAMEIIRELEPVARTVYCGSIGYISCDGNMDTSITIRTILAKDGELHCWGGGAIVADSDCESEYQESITKVRNLMNTLETYI
ncbi:aminodeoxychorismate synthase component I [Endozoicomonas sp. ONNA2]|uniref:aminodeoxychorismate synthase component I n=1 Tax=Endozoicomonas sp. ONNA2 TaxID=2828741 RepID=UPI0021481D8F|nr:aminodeoxychorismate synthase component I [Endozoicomonas sp. ONNA2]